MNCEYVIGIDLGTTNSVLAFARIEDSPAKVELLNIPQLVAESTLESLTSLPSFVYLASETEASGGGLDLPWAGQRQFALGNYARSRGAQVPERTVGAAKSWLCNRTVDRRQAILPWNAPEEVGKVSPVTASQRFLEHLVDAWHHRFPEAPIAHQQVVLTVPASFDPVARELTREAAINAGLPADFVLLEEPQAALYSWLEATGDLWRNQLAVGQQVLVCDVGGGTTDLTLIEVEDEQGALALRRVAVGEHLLVGGDNMDLALAHMVAQEFAKRKVNLNPWQSVSLWHSCRAAKEALLADDGPESQSISVLGRGSKLIGAAVSVQVRRDEIATSLIDGFLPRCEINDHPQQASESGFQELGLSYESDPGITRHVAAFLSRHCTDPESGEVKLPEFVLFNGGVFKADGFQRRLLETINRWRNENSATEIQSLQGTHDLDHAVARGACYYGVNKHRGGMRIRGGTARSYYVGIETAGMAIPGAPRPLKALCVVPFGTEEGTEIQVPSAQIGLVVGKPARFRFFSSTTRNDDPAGEQLQWWDESELSETDSMETTLSVPADNPQTHVPIHFESRVTELGVLELWCVGTNNSGRWKLEFDVRQQ